MTLLLSLLFAFGSLSLPVGAAESAEPAAADRGGYLVIGDSIARGCGADGAVVFRKIDGQTKFLLIKNCRSSNWGFPKGHMERGEDQLATAKREVLEETGLDIDVFEGFGEDSSYMIGLKVDKSVRIFLAATKDTKTIIQKEEIAAYTWLPYEDAYNALNFDNDKLILKKAHAFIETNGLDKI
ncbi:MAG: NUDIX domain-containing protein [Clostridia bacterium]|nr:NUDIX domain-containing protein [Clostridia bacterium]